MNIPVRFDILLALASLALPTCTLPSMMFSIAALIAQVEGGQINGEVDLGNGAIIAVAGLVIVFTALILISLFIGSLPRVLEFVGRHWPEVEEHHGRGSQQDEGLPDDDAVLAAIGFVLHTEFQKQLASGNTSSSN